jgi:hypothetical protein
MEQQLCAQDLGFKWPLITLHVLGQQLQQTFGSLSITRVNHSSISVPKKLIRISDAVEYSNSPAGGNNFQYNKPVAQVQFNDEHSYFTHTG